MASLESLIETALDAESTLTAIVGDRYSADYAPQNPTYPCLVYTVFMDENFTMDAGTKQGMVQFDVFASTKTECMSIRTPLETAMNNAAGFKAVFNGLQSKTPDDELDIKREIIDFRVWF